MTLTDEQINDMANVMRDGARHICDEAIGKWRDPNYIRGLENMVEERYTYWATIRANLPRKAAIVAMIRSAQKPEAEV
jgi:hypothetical protein